MTLKIFDKDDWKKVADPVEGSVEDACDLGVFDNGVGLTLEDDDGKTLGCGGVVLHDDDIGEVWLRMSRDAKPLLAYATMKAAIKILAASYPGVSLTCRVLEGFDKGERLATHLGFVKDHIDDKYWVYKCQPQH